MKKTVFTSTESNLFKLSFIVALLQGAKARYATNANFNAGMQRFETEWLTGIIDPPTLEGLSEMMPEVVGVTRNTAEKAQQAIMDTLSKNRDKAKQDSEIFEFNFYDGLLRSFADLERDPEYRQSTEAIVAGFGARRASSTVSPVVPQWKAGENAGKAELRELLSDMPEDKSARSFGM